MQLKMNFKNPELQKRMKIMLIGVAILFGSIIAIHLIKKTMGFIGYLTEETPAVSVSAAEVKYELWQPQIKATASVRAVLGVNVTTELAGMITGIYFTPGSYVKKNTILAQLNADPDIAQLHALQATAELNKITYQRDKAQFVVGAVSQQQVDNDHYNYLNSAAQVERQKAIVAKKTIRAPFDGRLGIRRVNLGQYLNPGDAVTMLQTLDPIYVDFNVPQEALTQLEVGQDAFLSLENFPKQNFKGKITTINPGVNKNTRNVEVEATLANPQHILAPGMYGSIQVNTGKPTSYLTLPETAISFHPYGEVVYVLTPQEKQKKKNQQLYIAKQHFVTTGDVRKDEIVIQSGLKEGDLVVTSGQLKLKNNSLVYINNEVTPKDNLPENYEDE